MGISSFLGSINNKNIFVLEGDCHLALESYETELVELLGKNHTLNTKHYYSECTTDHIFDLVHSGSLFGKSVIIFNSEKFPINQIKNIQNFFILKCKNCNSTVKKRDDIAHILLQKRYEVFNDLIAYYAKKNFVNLDFAASGVVANYLFSRQFSIESEIIKLKLYFGDKKIRLQDLSEYFCGHQISVNKLCRSILTSNCEDFFQNTHTINQSDGMLIIRAALKYFNVIFEFLHKLENKIEKEAVLHGIKKQDFYDTKFLDYALQTGFSAEIMKSVIFDLLVLEKKYKTTKLNKNRIILSDLYTIFVNLKNTKTTLEKS